MLVSIRIFEAHRKVTQEAVARFEEFLDRLVPEANLVLVVDGEQQEVPVEIQEFLALALDEHIYNEHCRIKSLEKAIAELAKVS
jgi:iron-sulfur cluster repair protein YtfE (RIC family)